jgi:hypothetical protein
MYLSSLVSKLRRSYHRSKKVRYRCNPNVITFERTKIGEENGRHDTKSLAHLSLALEGSAAVGQVEMLILALILKEVVGGSGDVKEFVATISQGATSHKSIGRANSRFYYSGRVE